MRMTDDIRRTLVEKAAEATENSYAPYSGFAVGAALLTEDGEIFTGVNIENASYGAGICAERSAVACAVTAGKRRFTAVAVTAYDSKNRKAAEAWPCGICRQVLYEFSRDMEIITGTADGEIKMLKISELLPEGFGPEALDSGR